MEKAEKEMTTTIKLGNENTLIEEDETEHSTPGISPTPSPEMFSETKDDPSEYANVVVCINYAFSAFMQKI